MKKQDFNFTPGMTLQGKWQGHTYRIIKKLGEGACGVVYLCKHNGYTYALKVGTDSSRMMLEVNMLKKFSKVQGVKLGPSFVDVDDWVSQKQVTYPFYVMEYVQGELLLAFLQGRTKDWIALTAVQLLSDLEHLHEAGYAFGDLKTDNLLMSASRIRWIDVGGVTAFGRAIKEFTEFYDRGYWGYGSRKAEAGYDLFAVTMIMLEMVYPKRFIKGKHPHKTLQHKLALAPMPEFYKKVISRCWQGKYQTAQEMKGDLEKGLMKRQATPSRTSRKKSKKPSTSRSDWGEWIAVSILVGMFYGLSLLNGWL
ncbi:protein kinase [Halobacillus shinanisalinarum]|uniref:Protein kinase n=1 Tax=Halobacillus shinanisalinarum TaxID=2932258 RepID=A0ABY4GTL8_9BACI|nr:protein kinase [Halobacillus shinanisalinarum]UOQ91369.1 protein kinase [Halobacillus shinanisalinarum]